MTSPHHLRGANDASLSMGEILCAFAYASDLAFGLQFEDSIRSCYIASRVAERMGLSEDERATVYYTALLKDAGCTSWATELAQAWQADEIAGQRAIPTDDPFNVHLLAEWMSQYVSRDRPAYTTLARNFRVMTTSRSYVLEGLGTIATIAARIAERLSMPAAVQEALQSIFERWDGNGVDRGLEGWAIPVAARTVYPSFFLSPIHRVAGREACTTFVSQNRGAAFDPDVADAFISLAGEEDFWSELESEDIRHRVMALEPDCDLKLVSDGMIDDVALAFADFIDLKSRYAAAHSRRVGTIAEQLARLLGCSQTAVREFKRAGLMHDIGLVAIPSFVLDRPWSDLSESERDQYRLHPYHGERILKRVPVLSHLADMVGVHQERSDGSGYYRGLTGANINLGGRIIAVADRLDELTHGEPGRRPALELTEALDEMRREPLDQAIVSKLTAALGIEDTAETGRRRDWPAGLSSREVEILRLGTVV